MDSVLKNRIVGAMGKCGCNPILDFLIEFPIITESIDNGNTIITFPITTDNIDNLKNKVICKYKEILDNLKCGILPDLSNILDDILKIYIKAGF